MKKWLPWIFISILWTATAYLSIFKHDNKFGAVLGGIAAMTSLYRARKEYIGAKS